MHDEKNGTTKATDRVNTDRARETELCICAAPRTMRSAELAFDECEIEEGQHPA